MEKYTMESQRLRRLAEKLTGPGALACALKPDGTLVVVDRTGHKLSFAPEAYTGLERKTVPGRGGKGAADEQPE